jgi:Fe-S-cluster containining protein
VKFYWREAEKGANAVPMESVEEFSDLQRVMRGTNDKHYNRCVELKGEIGSQVACQIYANRPSPCRNFSASFENGVQNTRCDEARAIYRLRPLGPGDFPAPEANGLRRPSA